MSHQACVRIPDDTYGRLKNLAEKTGRSATYYIREAIEDHLEDLEDIYLAEITLQKISKGKEGVTTLDDLEAELELDS